MTLEHFFNENQNVALGFSGGVDSSYLLYAGRYYGAKVKACFVNSVFQPKSELADAHRLAEQIGAEISVVEIDILSDARIVSNPPERCYICKTLIFKILREIALADGISLLIDGTNATDNADNRPGMRALAELSVRSPLRECGITKDEVRRLSKEAGLLTWDKPSYSCLATRVPFGQVLTGKLLQQIEERGTA
ncbi:MAG: ATP-dependent sacrificial sulfur transferase LarE [Chitinispirillales bacterium]|jgi:uncharacterized protein|nr:ATP-dependent sacrificial sulfur transferase LarE [Chitinispirillales bacterium]